MLYVAALSIILSRAGLMLLDIYFVSVGVLFKLFAVFVKGDELILLDILRRMIGGCGVPFERPARLSGSY